MANTVMFDGYCVDNKLRHHGRWRRFPFLAVKPFGEAQTFESLPYYTEKEQEAVNHAYESCRSISIDYAVMEQAKNVAVIDGDFGWSDIGTWGSLYDHLEKDTDSNACMGGDVLYFNTQHTLVKEELPNKLLVVAGLDNYVVADTQDVLLICPKHNEAGVKQIIEAVLEERGD